MLRPPRHRAPAAPPCQISAGMFRPIPSSNRRRAHRHPVAVRAAVPPARQRPLQARPPAPRVPAVQPRLRQRPRQLVRVACRTADATNSDREATPFWVAFRCPHPLMSIWRMHFNCPNKTAPALGAGVLGPSCYRVKCSTHPHPVMHEISASFSRLSVWNQTDSETSAALP
jgi:hypothetical protein